MSGVEPSRRDPAHSQQLRKKLLVPWFESRTIRHEYIRQFADEVFVIRASNSFPKNFSKHHFAWQKFKLGKKKCQKSSGFLGAKEFGHNQCKQMGSRVPLLRDLVLSLWRIWLRLGPCHSLLLSPTDLPCVRTFVWNYLNNMGNLNKLMTFAHSAIVAQDPIGTGKPFSFSFSHYQREN